MDQLKLELTQVLQMKPKDERNSLKIPHRLSLPVSIGPHPEPLPPNQKDVVVHPHVQPMLQMYKNTLKLL